MIRTEKKKSFFLCLIQSFILSGLGHIYVGHIKLGIGILAIGLFFVSDLVYEIVGFNAYSIVLYWVIISGIWIFGIIHPLLIIKNRNVITDLPFKKYPIYIIYIVFFIIVCIFSREYIYFNHLPSSSMAPTIRQGDYIASELIGSEAELKRGDLIIFKYPKSKEQTYMKRIVGLPGDRISINKKILYINGKPLIYSKVENVNLKEVLPEKFHKFKMERFTTQLGSKSFDILQHSSNLFFDYFPEVTVGEGEYFVLGDNFDFSSDSRRWGTVPREDIFGIVRVVLFSKNDLFGRINIKVQ